MKIGFSSLSNFIRSITPEYRPSYNIPPLEKRSLPEPSHYPPIPAKASDWGSFNENVGALERAVSAQKEVVDTLATPGFLTPRRPRSTIWENYEKYVRFVPIACAFAGMSKLPGTKVGCIILGEARQVLTSGWNGSARGCSADVDERVSDRTSRLDWTTHAEANAIANAARSGTALDHGVAITTMMPCMTCAKLLVQAGIEVVICPAPSDPRWEKDFHLTRELFDECNVFLYHSDTFGE